MKQKINLDARRPLTLFSHAWAAANYPRGFEPGHIDNLNKCAHLAGHGDSVFSRIQKEDARREKLEELMGEPLFREAFSIYFEDLATIAPEKMADRTPVAAFIITTVKDSLGINEPRLALA